MPGRISSVGDMLVVPSTSLPGLPLVAVRPEHISAELANAELFFRGRVSNTLTRYGVGDERLAINRVLAWSPDASAALVVGRLGDRRGVFELGGPEVEPRARLPRSGRAPPSQVLPRGAASC
jgi:hypothetical protein